MEKARTWRAFGIQMEIVLLLLWNALQRRRARTYSQEQIDAVARERAALDAAAGRAPALAAPKRPYRWWRYAGLR